MGECIKLNESSVLRPCGDDLTGFSTILVDLKRMVAGFTGDINLKKSSVDGTPPGKPVSSGNQTAIVLEKPTLTLRDGQLRGTATLSIGSNYPSHINDPLKIDVSLKGMDFKLSETPLVIQSQGRAGNISYGIDAEGKVLPEAQINGQARFLSIFTTDLSLRIHYDNKKLSQAVEAAIEKGGKEGTLNNLGSELRYPGLDLTALTKITLPILGKVPISKLSFSAPTTKPLQRPMPGSVFPIPYRYKMGGLVPTPPGTLFDTWAVGLGYSQSDFNGTRGSSFNAAILPTISVDGASSLVEKFPVYGYLEYYRIHRVSEGLDLGFRFTLSPSSVDLARLKGASREDEDSLMRFRTEASDLEQKTKARTMANFEVVGHF